MIEAAVPRMLAPFIELLSVHPPIPCKGKDRFNDPCDGGRARVQAGKDGPLRRPARERRCGGLPLRQVRLVYLPAARAPVVNVLQFPRLCALVRRSITRRMREGACRDLVAFQYGVSVRWLESRAA